MADADTVSGNADGNISLDELDAIPLTSLSSTAGYGSLGRDAAAETLEDYIYRSAFPAMVTFGDSGVCTNTSGSGRGED